MSLWQLGSIVVLALVSGCPGPRDAIHDCPDGSVSANVEPFTSQGDFCNLVCKSNKDCTPNDGFRGAQFCGTTDWLIEHDMSDTKVCQYASPCGAPGDERCPPDTGSTCRELGCPDCVAGTFCLPSTVK